MATTPGPLQAAPPADGPPDRTRLATLALHVSGVLYVLSGIVLALVPLAWDPDAEPGYLLRAGVTWFLAALCLGLAALAWATARGLRAARRWAWRTALALFALYLPSVFLPLGAVGLFGLLSEGTRRRFPGPRSDRARR